MDPTAPKTAADARTGLRLRFRVVGIVRPDWPFAKFYLRALTDAVGRIDCVTTVQVEADGTGWVGIAEGADPVPVLSRYRNLVYLTLAHWRDQDLVAFAGVPRADLHLWKSGTFDRDEIVHLLMPRFESDVDYETIEPLSHRSAMESQGSEHDPPIGPESGSRFDVIEKLRALSETSSDAQWSVASELIIREHVAAASADERIAIDTLGRIAMLTASTERIRADMAGAVDTARNLGLSWNAIGRAAGITPQAAHRRWDPAAKRKHAAYQRNRRRNANEDESGGVA